MADRPRSMSVLDARVHAPDEPEVDEVEVHPETFTRYADGPGTSAALHLLTQGCVRAMYRDDERPKAPSVQLMDFVPIGRRVKCNLSDGQEHGVAVLTAEVAIAVREEGARVKLVGYSMNTLASVRLCIVTKVEVQDAKGERIGTPRRFDGSSCDDVRALAILQAHFAEPPPPPPAVRSGRRAK